ncbi:MAG: hypothetical protein ACI9J3_003445 [Parvicellaceae bacterium]|jgi:hypothetical protein
MKHILIIIVLVYFNISAHYGQQVLNIILPNGTEISESVHLVLNDSVNGKVKAVYASDSSKTLFTGNFVNGKANGRFLYYYKNGKYMQTMIYGYGDLHGDYAVYNEKGQIIKKGIYKNGLKHGFWIDKVSKLQGRYKKGEKHLYWKKTINKELKQFEKWFFSKGELKKGDAKTAESLDL